MRELYPLLNRKSKLSPETKIRLYKTVIRPAITYGCQVWHAAGRTVIRRIEVVQSKALRMALNAPYYLANRVIARDAGVGPLHEHLRQLVEAFAKTLAGHKNSTISVLPEMSMGTQPKYPYPLNLARPQAEQAAPPPTAAPGAAQTKQPPRGTPPPAPPAFMPPARPPADPPPPCPLEDTGMAELEEAPEQSVASAPASPQDAQRPAEWPYRPYTQ